MKQILALLLIISFLISCRNEVEKKDKKNNFHVEAEFSFEFPDTIFVNKRYDGKINYKGDLDTITTSFDDINKNRYIYYMYTKSQFINYNDDFLKTVIKDTFGARNNILIPLYDVQFEKLGLNYIDGLIIDEVMIENGSKNEKGEPMTRIITNEFRATKKVIVIEKKEKEK